MDEEYRKQQQRDRDYDLLKHVSTLNVAALVLLIAFVDDFRPTPEVAQTAPRGSLLMLGLSLVWSMAGLLMTRLSAQEDGSAFFLIFVAGSYAMFLVGIGVAVVGSTAF